MTNDRETGETLKSEQEKTVVPAKTEDAEARTAGHPASSLLSGEGPSAIHAKISNGDPLHVQERATLRLRTLAVLLDPERLYERALLRIAFGAASYKNDPLGDWLDSRIDEAAQDLLDEDEELLRNGAVILDDGDPRYSFMSDSFAVIPSETLRACFRFNALGRSYRRALFALVIQDRSIEDCVEDGSFGARGQLVHRARYALEMLMFGNVELARDDPEFNGGQE